MLCFATVGSLCLTSCIVAEAPDYGQPRRTTPVIDRGSIVPQPTLQIRVEDGKQQDFVMMIFSEDAGENVIGSLFLNYAVESRRDHIRTVEIFPRAADQPKEMRFPFTPEADIPVPKGCHALTLFVMHKNNYDVTTQLPKEIQSDGDVATVTWWLNANPDAAGVPVPCPQAGQ